LNRSLSKEFPRVSPSRRPNCTYLIIYGQGVLNKSCTWTGAGSRDSWSGRRGRWFKSSHSDHPVQRIGPAEHAGLFGGSTDLGKRWRM